MKYPLLQSLYSESGGVHEGLPFYYKRGGKHKDKKSMQKLVEMNDHESELDNSGRRVAEPEGEQPQRKKANQVLERVPWVEVNHLIMCPR